MLGGVAGFTCLFVPVRFWVSTGPLMLLIAFALFLSCWCPGVGYSANGSTRWIRLGVLNLQASEPARLCLMIYLAGYLVRQNKSIREQFTGFLKPIVVLVIASSLLLLEPDLGAAIVLVATAFAMMFVAGARFRDFSVFAGLADGRGSFACHDEGVPSGAPDRFHGSVGRSIRLWLSVDAVVDRDRSGRVVRRWSGGWCAETVLSCRMRIPTSYSQCLRKSLA